MEEGWFGTATQHIDNGIEGGEGKRILKNTFEKEKG